MPWSNGTFTRSNGVNTGATTWATDESGGVGIVSSRHDTHDQDLATGINQCLNKDGSNYADAINVGHASDTTITRVSAGVIAVEGATIPTTSSGSYTGTATGLTTSETGTIYYRVVGSVVFLEARTNWQGTSNSTSFTITGAPTAIRPASASGLMAVRITDNGTTGASGTLTMETDGTLTVLRINSPSWTGSGTKTLYNFTGCYMLTLP